MLPRIFVYWSRILPIGLKEVRAENTVIFFENVNTPAIARKGPSERDQTGIVWKIRTSDLLHGSDENDCVTCKAKGRQASRAGPDAWQGRPLARMLWPS